MRMLKDATAEEKVKAWFDEFPWKLPVCIIPGSSIRGYIAVSSSFELYLASSFFCVFCGTGANEKTAKPETRVSRRSPKVMTAIKLGQLCQVAGKTLGSP